MKWLGSRIGAALDDWQGPLLLGLAIGSTFLLFGDPPSTAFIYGVGVAMGWVVMNVLFGVIPRKPQK